MTSQSVLKSVQIFRLGNLLWQIITLINYAYKTECLKLFKVADANLSSISLFIVL